MPIRRVLLVEDQPEKSIVYVRALRQRGYDVTLAEGLIQALQLINKHEYDLLTLGYSIPVPEQEELTRNFKKRCDGAVAVLRRPQPMSTATKAMKADRKLVNDGEGYRCSQCKCSFPFRIDGIFDRAKTRELAEKLFKRHTCDPNASHDDAVVPFSRA
jgi:CheY-like chemotaxis protein